MLANDQQLLRLIKGFAAIVALIVAIVPTVWFASHAYKHEALRLEGLADVQAYLVTQLINRNPVLWQFETHRIDEILARTHSYENPVSFQVLDSDSEVAAAHVSNGLDDLVLQSDLH